MLKVNYTELIEKLIDVAIQTFQHLLWQTVAAAAPVSYIFIIHTQLCLFDRQTIRFFYIHRLLKNSIMTSACYIRFRSNILLQLNSLQPTHATDRLLLFLTKRFRRVSRLNIEGIH